MKKSNLIIIISFILVIAVAASFMLFKKSGSSNSAENEIGTVAYAESGEIPTVGYGDKETDGHKEAKKALFESEPTKEKNQEPREYKTMPMDDALFIGDSRTVGLSDYGKIEGAEFFSDVGMSVYNIFDKNVKVSSVGRVSLKTLLENNEYSKIYLMLGINEAGYEIAQTVEKYEQLVDFAKEKEPDAKIFIMANLHVSNAKSSSGSYINNKTLDKINEGISAFAQKDNVFFLDVNELFDDNNRGLAPSKTGDGVHLYAKYYVEWGKWIVDRSAQIWEENGF